MLVIESSKVESVAKVNCVKSCLHVMRILCYGDNESESGQNGKRRCEGRIYSWKEERIFFEVLSAVWALANVTYQCKQKYLVMQEFICWRPILKACWTLIFKKN